MKAGLMEIADIFVLNKSDRDGADRLQAELEAMLHLAPPREGWSPKIVRTVATENKGLDELTAVIDDYRKLSAAGANGQREKDDKKIAHWKLRLVALAEDIFVRRAISGSASDDALDVLAREVASRRKDPYSAARELIERAGRPRNN